MVRTVDDGLERGVVDRDDGAQPGAIVVAEGELAVGKSGSGGAW